MWRKEKILGMEGPEDSRSSQPRTFWVSRGSVAFSVCTKEIGGLEAEGVSLSLGDCG